MSWVDSASEESLFHCHCILYRYMFNLFIIIQQHYLSLYLEMLCYALLPVLILTACASRGDRSSASAGVGSLSFLHIVVSLIQLRRAKTQCCNGSVDSGFVREIKRENETGAQRDWAD